MRCTRRMGLGSMLFGAAMVVYLDPQHWRYESERPKSPDEVRGAVADSASTEGTSIVAEKNLIAMQGKSCQIPHIIHQTWKDREVQSVFEPRIASWIGKNPEWEYRFWTDADNRELIKTVYPESLAMFDGYHSNIQRADAIRYFILYEFGGMYADLDFEALRPLGRLLESSEMADVGVILGQEPYAHSRVLYDQPRMLCNAIMISCPHHPFWKAVIDELHARYDAGIKTVRATGPRMLTDVVEAWMNTPEGSKPASMPAVAGGSKGGDAIAISSGLGRLYIPEPEMFYPQFDDGNVRVRQTCEEGKCFECKQKDAEGHLIRKDGPLSPRQVEACNKLKRSNYMNNPAASKESIATHHWAHTWLGQNLHHGTVSVDEVVRKARDAGG